MHKRAKRLQNHVGASQPKGCSLAPSLVLAQHLPTVTSKATTNPRETQGLMFNRLRSGVGRSVFLVFEPRAVLLQGELGTPITLSCTRSASTPPLSPCCHLSHFYHNRLDLSLRRHLHSKFGRATVTSHLPATAALATSRAAPVSQIHSSVSAFSSPTGGRSLPGQHQPLPSLCCPPSEPLNHLGRASLAIREGAVLALLAFALQVSEALLYVTSTRMSFFAALSFIFDDFAFFVSTTGLRGTLWFVFRTTLVTKLALSTDPGIARHLRRGFPPWTHWGHCRQLAMRLLAHSRCKHFTVLAGMLFHTAGTFVELPLKKSRTSATRAST